MVKSCGFDQPRIWLYEPISVQPGPCRVALQMRRLLLGRNLTICATISCFFLVNCVARGPVDPPSPVPPPRKPLGAAPAESAAESTRESNEAKAPIEEERNIHGGDALAPSSPAPEGRELPKGTKVLHVGDSFAGALGLPLGEFFEESAVRSVLKHTDASYLTDWAWDGKLQKMIWKYNPDLVLITLGGNELEIAEPEQRERTVKKIISIVGDRPCVWVAVPLWKGPQNGLLDVIARSVAPCVFLDTARLIDVEKMPRLEDGIHPTKDARRSWAEAVLAWLKDHRRPTEFRPWALRAD
jgi:hypothetical protein